MHGFLPELPKIKKLERLADPEYKQEYEMPQWYQERLGQFVELLESRDEYKKSLSSLPPEAYAEALPMFEELDSAVEILEQRLADEYENYQEEQRREQELDELKWDQEQMSEELFIWVKHKKPYLFEKFAEFATKAMTAAEREAHYESVVRREAVALDAILASPKPPALEFEQIYVKHLLPDERYPEILLAILLHTYETDDFFLNNYEALERGIDTKREYVFHMYQALPVRRRNMQDELVDLKKRLNAGGRFLLEYAEEHRRSGKFFLREKFDVQKLAELYETCEANRLYKYIVIKHTMPARLDEYVRIVTEDFTPAETEEFLKSVAECELTKTRALFRSLEYERRLEEIVEARRVAGDRKIDGPSIDERKWQKMVSRDYVKLPDPKTDDKPDFDPVKRYDRNLRAFYAVTGDRNAARRFEDAQTREDDELDAMLKELDKHHEELFLIIKHEKPELFPEFEKIVTDSMPPVEKREFYERIKLREAEMKRKPGN